MRSSCRLAPHATARTAELEHARTAELDEMCGTTRSVPEDSSVAGPTLRPMSSPSARTSELARSLRKARRLQRPTVLSLPPPRPSRPLTAVPRQQRPGRERRGCADGSGRGRQRQPLDRTHILHPTLFSTTTGQLATTPRRLPNMMLSYTHTCPSPRSRSVCQRWVKHSTSSDTREIVRDPRARVPRGYSESAG